MNHEMPSFVVPQIYVLFLCIRNCDEPWRWQRAKYECMRNAFCLTLDIYVIYFICTFCWDVQGIIIQCLHTVLYAYHVCHFLYTIRCILKFCLHPVYGKEKIIKTIFIISMLKCGYYGLFVFIASVVQLWMKTVFEIKQFLPQNICMSFVAFICTNNWKKKK